MKTIAASKVAAIADLPIKISDTAAKAIGNAKSTGAGLIFEVALDTEMINVTLNEAKTTPEDLAKKLQVCLLLFLALPGYNKISVIIHCY